MIKIVDIIQRLFGPWGSRIEAGNVMAGVIPIRWEKKDLCELWRVNDG